MKKAGLFVPLLAIIIVGVIAMPASYRTTRQDDSDNPGFPIRIVFEERLCCIGPQTWQASIEIPRDYYSRENLDRLFRFYSLRHPNMQERLYVKVYARKLNTSGRNYPISVPWIPLRGKDLHQESDVVRPDATFDRAGDGAAAFGGRNEWYSYRPDLDNADKEQLVILKGTLIHRPKKILETWKKSNGNINVRVLAYYLEGVDPAGVFYTFQSYDTNWSEWQSIMTSRQDQSVPIPTNSITFVTEHTAYVMMGSMYAVTTDNGATWSAWDAERDFELGRWCDHWLIRHVEVTASGKGTMKLSPSAQLSNTSILHTSDFGRNWNTEQ